LSNRKWTAAIVILFLLFVYLLLRFWFSALHTHELVKPLKAPASGDNPPRHIVLISQETDNPFWRAIEQGAREASEKYGMHLEYIGPFRINPAEQIKLLEKTIAAKADAVVIQGINDPNYRSLIDKAEAQGTPVIAVDTDEPGSRRLSYVGTDNLKAGVMMGELVVQASGARGKVGVLIGNEQADNQQLRLKGFRSVISRYPELTIVAVRSSDISRLQAAQHFTDIAALTCGAIGSGAGEQGG
jgi:ribose transport system substrate-binding protein